MSKILVTGAAGFLGKSVSEYFSNKGHEVFPLTRKELDVTNKNQVTDWFAKNKVDFVIHTAVKGGRRGEYDGFSDYVANIKMFENLFENKHKFSMMIHFGSGAEFDRKNHINCYEEDRVFDSMPEDFYGLSKNMIARKILKHKTNIYNFRLFGCFGKNEEDNRLLKILSNGIIEQSETFIEGSKSMDFFYDMDVCRAIEFYMNNYNKVNLPRDVNLVYEDKFTIKEISDHLEKVLGKINRNLKLNEITTNSYTGDWKLCSKTFPEDLFIGLKQAISKIYSVEG